MIKKLEKYFIPTLILSAILAMIICFFISSMQSVWFDEAYSIQIAKHPLDQLINLTAIDTHPPLYYLLLKLWAGIFGWSEIALRSLSILSMGGAVIFAGLLVKKLFNARTSIITLPFIIFAPFLLRYGFEIRMYALASLICIAATYFLVCALESKSKIQTRRFYILYAVLVAIGVYTLYYTVLVWIAHLLWLLWRARQNKEKVVSSDWFKAYIGSVILFLPWLPLFLKQITNGALAPISQPMTIDNLVGIFSFSFLYRPNWQLDALLSIIMVFVMVTVIYLSFQVFKIITDKKQRQYLILLLMYVLVPIAILTIIGLFRPMYVERYLAHLLIAGSMFIGICVAVTYRKLNLIFKISSFALVFVMFLGMVQLATVGNYNFQRVQNIQIKQAAREVNCEDGSAVFAAGPYEAIEFSYYLGGCKIYFYSDQAKLGGGYAMLSNSELRIADPSNQLNDKKIVYYVHYGDAKLQMPIDMINVKSQKFDSLVVEKYEVK